MRKQFIALKKFVDFAYVDLETITNEQKKALLEWLLVGVEFKSEKVPEEAEKNMLNLQRHLLEKIKSLDQEIKIARLRHQLIQQKKELATRESIPIVWAEHLNITMSCEIGSENFCDRSFDENTISTTSLFQDEVFRVLECRFFQAVDKLPVTALKQCPECHHYFIHTSKREKIYCSNKCAAKKNARDKRAELKKEKGEGYQRELKAGARRARKSYEKKVRSKMGNQSQRVDRRPYKYKNETEED